MWSNLMHISPSSPSNNPRVHLYDVYDNTLTEIHEAPPRCGSIFKDLLITDDLEPATSKAFEEAEEVHSALESTVQATLIDILRQTVLDSPQISTRKSLPIPRAGLEAVRKYCLFLRFRNGSGYRHVVESLNRMYQAQADSKSASSIYPVFHSMMIQLHMRHVLREIVKFLTYSPSERAASMRKPAPELPTLDLKSEGFQRIMERYLWRLCNAEISLGFATEEQEFIMSDSCFGMLVEGFEDDGDCQDFFFPIHSTLSLYVMGDESDEDMDSASTPPASSGSDADEPPSSHVSIDVGLESAVDVHLRNTMVLQTYPHRLYFVSLRPIALSSSSYDEFRWTAEHQDYSRLRLRARQKFLQETVTKTLTVKANVVMTDLTDGVKVVGEHAVAYGSFSDVWMGEWEDPIERRKRKVALKFLRAVVVKGVREKLLKRLQAEVVAWHRLSHRNVSQLFGVYQSPTSIAMVSQWCENGTMPSYLKRLPKNEESGGIRMKLLVQVASGISYLHTVRPNIIHGDLKGCNILIDGLENAIITDFGLSKVKGEISEDLDLPNGGATSFFAGSTRWMAPELIKALIEDDVDDDSCSSSSGSSDIPLITTSTDVYAYASVCLEVATDQLPYAHRMNDHAVTYDLLRGVKPWVNTKVRFCDPKGSCESLLSGFMGEDNEKKMWVLMKKCWSDVPDERPDMKKVWEFMRGLYSEGRERRAGLHASG
ncbi:hypothetical protein CVT24_009205 [Panaeolus cyanescens]|uniref:Protein kinase domain-containing protein n=1 Tax=Panaeolus cyanescens TaxID=181874 RepID=A0A409Y8D5_9AGAR|nr:hypothetical protein CVT24_009205 [Panaeolus cyanescens]